MGVSLYALGIYPLLIAVAKEGKGTGTYALMKRSQSNAASRGSNWWIVCCTRTLLLLRKRMTMAQTCKTETDSHESNSARTLQRESTTHIHQHTHTQWVSAFLDCVNSNPGQGMFPNHREDSSSYPAVCVCGGGGGHYNSMYVSKLLCAEMHTKATSQSTN